MRKDFLREAQSLYENLKRLAEKVKTGAEELEVDEEKREKAARKFMEAASIGRRLESLEM